MKIHVEVQDVEKLPKEERSILDDWWEPKIGDMFYYTTNGREDVVTHDGMSFVFSFPLLSIGQMWQFLGERNHPVTFTIDLTNKEHWINLCDELWEEVKGVLKNEAKQAEHRN